LLLYLVLAISVSQGNAARPQISATAAATAVPNKAANGQYKAAMKADQPVRPDSKTGTPAMTPEIISRINGGKSICGSIIAGYQQTTDPAKVGTTKAILRVIAPHPNDSSMPPDP
jgi:hypothetical protein